MSISRNRRCTILSCSSKTSSVAKFTCLWVYRSKCSPISNHVDPVTIEKRRGNLWHTAVEFPCDMFFPELAPSSRGNSHENRPSRPVRDMGRQLLLRPQVIAVLVGPPEDSLLTLASACRVRGQRNTPSWVSQRQLRSQRPRKVFGNLVPANFAILIFVEF